jgi:hypothetical protein
VTKTADPLYVYGILPAADRDVVSVEGVEGSEVGTVVYDGLAALTSHVRKSALSAAREVRAHWRVLQEATIHTTVLPMRFGTVLEGEDAVREQLLEPNLNRLTLALKQISGCVQLTLKGDYREPAVLREIVTSKPAIAALAARVRSRSPHAAYYERIRLGEQVATELARMRDADTARAMDLLEPLAESARAEEGGPISAFNLSFLVRRARQEEFTRSVRALRDETRERIELRYIGPLPPYSFADTGLEPGRSQWV